MGARKCYAMFRGGRETVMWRGRDARKHKSVVERSMLTYQQAHPSQESQPQAEQEQSPFILTVGCFGLVGLVGLNLSYLDIRVRY